MLPNAAKMLVNFFLTKAYFLILSWLNIRTLLALQYIYLLQIKLIKALIAAYALGRHAL